MFAPARAGLYIIILFVYVKCCTRGVEFTGVEIFTSLFAIFGMYSGKECLSTDNKNCVTITGSAVATALC